MTTFYFQKACNSRTHRIRRGVSGMRTANVYNVWKGTGKIYKRTGKEKRECVGTIVGRQGEWFQVRYETSGYKTSGPFKTREEAAQARKGSSGKPSKPSRKYFGVRRGYGDDMYSWAVYDKRSGRTVVDGESRQQAGYLADKLEKEAREKECGCRAPKSHQDCAYCGCGGDGIRICGVCAEAGIDHDESLPNRGIIRGTERKTCAAHSN